jgi:hypothetical protein
LDSLKESQFWCDKRNCNVNFTKFFTRRIFNYHVDKNLKKISFFIDDDKCEQNKIVNKVEKKNDYVFINTSRIFIDVSMAITKSDKRTFYPTVINKLDMTKEQITNIICQIDNIPELYHTFNALLTSKDYCHMVLNNEKVLDKVNILFKIFGPIYKYLIGYAMMSFIFEECIKKTKTTKNDRYVFDINTANKLPCFPFLLEDLKQNPYLTILIDDKEIPKKNNISLQCVNSFENYYGFCNLEEFKKRFNLFVTGDSNVNIFNGIDWNCFAISGSIITPCIQKKPILFDKYCDKNNDDKQNWLNFFNECYNSSDVDIMCNVKSIFEFITKTEELVNLIKKNTPNYQYGDIEIEPIKSSWLTISRHFYTERLDDFNNYIFGNFTTEEMKEKFNSDEMRDYLFSEYLSYKSKINNIIRKEKKDNNEFIKSFMLKVSSDELHYEEDNRDFIKNNNFDNDNTKNFYINDFRKLEGKELVSENENYLVMKISEGLKFTVKSKNIKKIEIFRSVDQDFFSMVSKFHIPCVRAVYQDNVYILPSCITSMMTGINTDYKYVLGKKDLVDIFNKNRKRGFGNLLNSKEILKMLVYNNNLPIDDINHIDLNNNTEIEKFYEPMNLNNKIFEPIHVKTNNNIVQRYIQSLDDLKSYYKIKYNYDESIYPFDLFKIKTITKTGDIYPLKKWISREYFDITYDATKHFI